MPSGSRVILEAELCSAQRPYTPQTVKVVHREVLSDPDDDYVNWLAGWWKRGQDGIIRHHSRVIMFEDGSALRMMLRDTRSGERVVTLKAYSSLIRNCWKWGAESVRELCAKQAVERQDQIREIEEKELSRFRD